MLNQNPKRAFTSLLGLGFLALLILPLTAVQGQTVHPDYVDGELYIRLERDAAPLPEFLPHQPGERALFAELQPAWSSLLDEYGITQVRNAALIDDPELKRFYEISFTDIEEVEALMNRLRVLPGIDLVEQRVLNRLFYQPNDFRANVSSHILQTRVLQAFDYFRGSEEVVVAVVDDAVRTSHEDLNGVLWENPGEIPGDSIDNDNNGWVDDLHGWDMAGRVLDGSGGDNDPMPPSNATANRMSHGSHTSGIAAAQTDNGVGMVSPGFRTRLMAIKASADTTNGLRIHRGYDGVQYAIANQADVINLSWGGGQFSIFAQTVLNTAANSGIVVVAAAGNDGQERTQYPAAYDGVIAVGAVTSTDVVTSYSNRGAWVDICAPGSIYSCLGHRDDRYGVNTGTSMASPLVAGIAALMKSYNPSLSPTEIEQCIKSTAQNIDGQNASLVGKFGAGRINAEAALQCVRPASCLVDTLAGHLDNRDLTSLSDATMGYPAGVDSQNTVAKAQYFTNERDFAGQNRVAGLRVQVAAVQATAGSDSILFSVWGTDSDDRPSARIGQVSRNLGLLAQEISQGDSTLELYFDTPLPIKGRFYAGFDYSALASNSQFAVKHSVPDTSANASSSSWAQAPVGGGTWLPLSNYWQINNRDLHVELAIEPILTAPEAGVAIDVDLPTELNAGDTLVLNAQATNANRFVWQVSGVGQFQNNGAQVVLQDTGAYNIRVLVINEKGCSSSDSGSVQVNAVADPISRNDAAQQQLAVFPNPGREHANFQLPDSWVGQPVELQAYNLNGRQLVETTLQAAGAQLSWSVPQQLGPGVYLLRLRQGEEVAVLRWVRSR